MPCITVKAGELARAATAAAFPIRRKNTIPVLDCLLLMIEKTCVSLTGTDLDLSVTGRFDATHDCKGGMWAVPARALKNISRAFPRSDILKLTMTNGFMVVDGVDVRFRIPLVDCYYFPPGIRKGDEIERFDTFAAAHICRLLPFVSDEETRYYLNGISIEDHCWVATTGRALAVVSMGAHFTPAGNKGVFPRRACLAVKKLLKPDSTQTVSIGETWFQVGDKKAGITVTTKKIDCTYPDWRRVVPKNFNAVIGVERKKLVRGVTAAKIAIRAIDPFSPVHFVRDPDGVLCLKSRHSIVSLGVTASAIKQTLDAHILADAVGFFDEADLNIAVSDEPYSPVRIDSPGAADFVICMPMRATTSENETPISFGALAA